MIQKSDVKQEPNTLNHSCNIDSRCSDKATWSLTFTTEMTRMVMFPSSNRLNKEK